MDQDSYVAELEEELRKARALVERQQALVAHVSHELRTPMNGVLGMTRLLLDTPLRTAQREYAQTIWSSADALVTLINDLLDRAKLESGKLELESIPFHVGDVVRDTIRSLEVIAAEKGIELRASIASDLPRTVLGDPTRLRQVLVNLVGNAIKFTDEGSVEVRVRPGAEEVLHFAVADTGVGISSDRLASIFEAFQQASTSTTRTHGGTGLGLAITSHLVELAGGTIEVESEVGEGTTFSFTIVAPVPELPPREKALVRVSHRALVLASAGYRALLDGACSATDIAVCEVDELAPGTIDDDHSYDLTVVADEDPLETVETLRSRWPEAATIVITPAGQRGDASRCRDLGVAAYLTGPLIEADVVAAIEAIGAGEPGLITRHWLRERRTALRVLVADDSPTNRLVASHHLEERGHDAVCVENGREAVQALSGGSFDVVLMDIQMPVLDGYGAALAIRSLESPASDVPIIALTGSVDDQVRCFEAGMNRFLTKPYRVETLFSTIETLVGR